MVFFIDALTIFPMLVLHNRTFKERPLNLEVNDKPVMLDESFASETQETQ
jgi:hypothetical protein